MKFVPNAVTVQMAKQVLLAQKHSPRMLFVAGVAGMGATVVLACKATLKVDEVLDQHEKSMLNIDIVVQKESGRGYSAKDAKKDRALLLTKTSLRIAKLYAPAAGCGLLSVAALTGSHHILSNRNTALVAAYSTLEKSFAGYRDRVTAEVGREKEAELYQDAQACEIEDERGKKTTIKVPGGGSPYAALYDQTNINWEPIPQVNWTFLKAQQNWANQRLQAKGHLFLNDVRKALGLEETPAGQIVGWIKGEGDDYIDFGIFNHESSERVVDFMTGREKGIWLDFNVDGVIYNKI